MNELDRYAVSLENMEVLRAQVEELEAWKAEELALMNPLMDYARSVCTGPLGCSLTDWLVSDHKAQAREIDRYRSALDSIATKASQSRSVTRRLTWIEGKAQSALEKKPWAAHVFMMPSPKNALPKAERLREENLRLKRELAALSANP